MNSNQKRVVVLGKFDGIHIGHASLISAAADIASEKNMSVTVYTIGVSGTGAITDETERIAILKLMGADNILYRPLDEGLRNMLPREFVQKILVSELNAGYVVVGDNFRFGKDRCADSCQLREICREYGVEVIIINTVCMDDGQGDNIPVSSTFIRSLVSEGRVEQAAKALGRYFFVKGVVSEGKHLGTGLGFPTINIYPDANALIPKYGVYASKVIIDGKEYHAITNVGDNPTVENTGDVKIETHIFDFNENCYGKSAYVNFVEFIREEIRFKDIDRLSEQVKMDIQTAKKLLKHSH